MNTFYCNLIILFVLFSPAFFAQVKTYNINNRADGIDIHLNFSRVNYVVKDEEGKRVLEFTGAINEGKPGAPVLPTKTIYVAIPPNSRINPVFTNKEENVISDVDIEFNPELKLNEERIVYKKGEPALKYFINDVYPSKEVGIMGYTWVGSYYCAVIQINTYRYNWKKKEVRVLNSVDLKIDFSDVKPFTKNNQGKSEFDKTLREIIINYKSADQFRSSRTFSADTTGDWIDYNKEYVKLALSDDGIYKISYADLQSYGVDLLFLNPLTFKIFFKGKQIPLFVYGENDLSFDQNDYIEFWGEKNYGSTDYRQIVPVGKDYLNYYDRYNDTNFVWFTWGGDNGIRTDSIHSFIPGLTDSVQTHLVKIHMEDNKRLWYYDAVAPRVQLPDWQENKVWTWNLSGSSGSSSYNFDSPDFIPGTSVKTIVRLISNAADIVTDAHANGTAINSDTPEDTIIYDFKQTVNLESEFSSDILNQTDNVYRVFGLPTQASFQQSLIDWIDIDFYRSNVAVNDSLMITIPDSVISSERVIVAANFDNPDVYIYKVKPQFKRVIEYNFSSGTITFTDNVSGGDKYLIIGSEYKRTPRFVVKKNFVNLRNSERSADYIILTNKVLQESVGEYKSFVETNYQLKVEVIYIDDIYDEFSFGLDKAEAVRDFLLAANVNWQSPKPSYLNVIGDANYDYKKTIVPPTNIIRENLVPAYGNPVSDTWYAMWDSSEVNVPQMFVGRIPARNNEEVLFYLQKHQTYINRQYDSWNKNYLFFSGGDIANPGQLAQIKNTNDNLLNEVVMPKPVGGSGIHFYRTVDPPTNFGPYALSEVRNAIDNGGLFISYIGHSGTQTWDNGIISTEDLKNVYSDRNPLVTDFGCSTGKFSEPDVDAFGELFLLENPNGQAINYLGNSSFGYLSTSLRFPGLFYRNLLIDETESVGAAHLLAKLEQFAESGYTEVNRVFNYCNFLFGDPVIHFKTPLKPNFVVSENSFSLSGDNPNDMTDSVTLTIQILNTGRVSDDSLNVSITSTWSDEITYQSQFKIPMPLFRDTIEVNIPVEGKVGQHIVDVELDNQNLIDEIYETDNSASYVFTVFSTSVRPVEAEKFYNTARSTVRVLNPVLSDNISTNQIRLSLSNNPDFTNAADIYEDMDSVYTSVDFSSLVANERYWWKVKLNDPQQEWSATYSFKNINKNFTWFIDESFVEDDGEYFNSKFDSVKGAWLLTKNENLLEISSASTDDGEFGSMIYNGQELLPTTFYWGIATAEIDTVTLKPSNFRYFLYWDGNANELMKAYLDSLPLNKIIAMAICADGAQSVLGFDFGTEIRRTIEGFGSLYADSIQYRDSWCMIGRKGAAPGTVPESFKRRFFGITEVSLSNEVNNTDGYVVFPFAGISTNWINLEKQDSLPTGSSIDYFPLGRKANGEIDTLDALLFSNNIADLSHVDPLIYPSVKILAELKSNETYESPSVKSLGINFGTLPELAVNYQSVSIDTDTLLRGEDVKLDFVVYNPGETRADSFNVQVEVIYPDNSREPIFEKTINSLSSLDRKYFNVNFNTSNGSGNRRFNIKIDPDNKVPELFEDNNFYEVPFYVKPDTSVPSLNITFDGVDIMDGEYISSNPEIKIELFDQSLLPINDPSAVSLFLNNVEVSPDSSVISYEYNTANPKVIVTYEPQLKSGEYTLKVFGKNAAGNVVDSSGVEKYFVVNEETKILYVYSYPNPTNGKTYFTFKLTQIPDELKIKIYTVAGRMIKEITETASELNFDFNRVYWDGKDTDRNEIANGVYFYKIIISKDGKSEDVTQKLAVVR